MKIELIMSKYKEGGMVTNLSVKNEGQDTAYGYTVETEFFNDKNIFIGECSSFQITSIEPGETENVEVYCEEQWREWYKNVVRTEAKFRNTTGSYRVTIKPI